MVLQPGDSKILITYKFPIKTSSSDSSNYIPYGCTISGALVTATTSDGTDATSDLIYSNPIVSDDSVIVPYKYPTINGEGTYHVKFILQIDNDSTMECDFNRIIARDL